MMAASPAAVAETAEPALKRGVNLSHWLQYGGRQPIVPADLSALRALGFDHVRLPFDPAQFGWRAVHGGERGASWERLDRAVAMVLDAGLAAILDFHPSAADKAAIEIDADAQAAFVSVWRDLALRYRATPSDRLVFELLNEPDFDRGGAAAANDLKRRTIGAIRAVDRERLLLLASIYAKETVAQLKANEIVRDGRVRYVFHFYDPHIFTHFGANWGSYSRPPYTLIQSLRYPFWRMDRGAPEVFDRPGKATAVKLVEEYVDQRWDAARIEKSVAAIAAWARDNKVRVICTEFGVLRTRVDGVSRMIWLRDARTALERHGIPWSLWDYADIFGIATATGELQTFGDGAIAPRDRANPRRRFDNAALLALGLAPP